MVMGTVDYMAPEQGMSTKNADARADIYSLGCTLHYLLIGKARLRWRDGDGEDGRSPSTSRFPICANCGTKFPQQVDAVFQKMVAKKIEDRYQTMTEVVADLERCGVGRDVSFSGQQSLGLGYRRGPADISQRHSGQARRTSRRPRRLPRRLVKAAPRTRSRC